ncbi:hypothetical protein [Stenotrophomonas sp. YIM B13575]|uniref:hypothetical protein n=1 Tax=Stenotrophomonas sp. YIM B13575 TaxID=3366314 RepID=UPI0036A2C84D
MTPSEIEARFAKYDERIASLEDAHEADSWTITALIGSHPNLKMLLGLIGRAIQAMRDRTASEDHDPSYERILRQLLQTEKTVLQAIASRERVLARRRAEEEKQRAASPARRAAEQDSEQER